MPLLIQFTMVASVNICRLRFASVYFSCFVVVTGVIVLLVLVRIFTLLALVVRTIVSFVVVRIIVLLFVVSTVLFVLVIVRIIVISMLLSFLKAWLQTVPSPLLLLYSLL